MILLQNFKNYLVFREYKNSTIDLYESAVYNFLKSLESLSKHHITVKQLESYLHLKNFKSTSQKNQYISALRLFFIEILGKKEISLKNVNRPRKKKTLPQCLNPQNVISIINGVKNKKHKAIFTLLFGVGLRRSEIINLKVKDICGVTKSIRINQGKGKKDRIVMVSGNILNTLREYYKEYKPNDYLFNGQLKGQYSESSIYNLSKKYFKVSPHKLRHTYARAILEAGNNMNFLRDQLGHERISTTQIYSSVTRKQFTEIF